jgi:ketosteroid isomerase-like protein
MEVLMRFPHLLLVLVPLAVSSSRLSAQLPLSKTTFAPAEQLRRLEDGWTTALVKRDSAFFNRNLHPDYVYSDERGVSDKKQVIAEQIAGSDTVTSAENQDMRVHVHGSAAAVTGILIVRGRGTNGAFEHRYRYTDSFVREGGRWLMFASQDYEIPRR